MLDESLDDGCHFHEHNIKGPDGYYNVYEQCPKEFYTCPLCERFGDSAFVLYLSVLHLNAWKDKQTGEYRNGRTLLGIKYSQLQQFKKVLKMAEKEHGTLRGVVLNLERPTGRVQDSPRIGQPVEFEDVGKRYDFIEDLEGEYGHAAIQGQDKTTIVKAANLDITPFDYEVIFPGAFNHDACIEDLRARYQGEPTAGTQQADRNAWADDDDDDEEQSTRSRRSRRAEPEEEDAAPASTAPRVQKRGQSSDAPPSRRARRDPDEGGESEGGGQGWA
jgi:hypothetical protein